MTELQDNIIYFPLPERLDNEQRVTWSSRLRTLEVRREVKLQELEEVEREIEDHKRVLGFVAIETGLTE